MNQYKKIYLLIAASAALGVARANAQADVDRSKSVPAGPIRNFTFPVVEETPLEKGAKLALMEIHRSPLVSLRIVIPLAGTAFESKDKVGLAGIVTALMREGLKLDGKELDGRGFEAASQKIGASIKVSPGVDAMTVTVFSTKSKFAEAVHLAAALLLSPLLPQKELDRIKQETLTELQMGSRDPENLASKRLGQRVFGTEHPYSFDGSESTVNNIDMASIENFRGAHIRPEGAIFAAAGDIKLSELKKVVEKNFGNWSAAVGAPAPETLTIPTLPETGEAAGSPDVNEKGMVIDVIDIPNSPQSAIRAGHRSIAKDDPDGKPLLLVDAILGGASFISRLNKNLREAHQWTYGASSNISNLKYAGFLAIETDVETQATAPAVQEILKEMGRLQTEPVSAEELNAVKSYILGNFVMTQQTVQNLAAEVANIEVNGRAKDSLNSVRDRILAITPEQIQQAAQKHLRPQELKIVISGDAEKIVGDLKAIAPVRIIHPGAPQEAAPADSVPNS